MELDTEYDSESTLTDLDITCHMEFITDPDLLISSSL